MKESDTISALLDALAPDVAETEAWDDVLARAELLGGSPQENGRVQHLGRTPRRAQWNVLRSAPRRPRGLVLVGLLALAFIVLGATAYAVGRSVLDFSSAPPAPQHVVKDFDFLFSDGAPPGMDPQVVAGETKLVADFGPLELWVAPTKRGGICFEWREWTGGCDALGTVPIETSAHDGAGSKAIYGRVNARWADSVEIEFDDGSIVHPRVIWVSAPIDFGFFYHRLPEGRSVASVLALQDGEVVAGDGKRAEHGAHPFADLSQRDRVAEIDTAAGSVTLWTAPTKTEGRCSWLEFQGRELPVTSCLPKGYEHQRALTYSTHTLGGHTILAGGCGYTAIRFVHGDGTTRTVECANGLVLADLQPADVAGELCTVGEDGQPLARGCHLLAPTTQSTEVDGHEVTAFVVLQGSVLTSTRPPSVHPHADLTRRTRIGRVATTGGVAMLWTAPTKTGGGCTWLEYGGEEIPVLPCQPAGSRDQVRLSYAVFASRTDGTLLAVDCGDGSAVRVVGSDRGGRTVDCSGRLGFTPLGADELSGRIRVVDRAGRAIPGASGFLERP